MPKYGWKRDLPDARDFLYADHAPLIDEVMLPAAVDLRSECPPVVNQGNLGSCTANAIAASVQFLQMKNKIPSVPLSRLFIYYQERLKMGTVAEDSGASIRESAKVVADIGSPPETDWPYDISKFTQNPPQIAYDHANSTKITQYLAVNQSEAEMKSCLASGFLINIGFTVYTSFESAQMASTGVGTMPDLSTEKVIGGHAVVIVGYDDSTRRWLCRNSWGTGWGQRGYFTMPYEYFTNPRLAADFWTLRVVTGPTPPPPTPTPIPKPVDPIFPYQETVAKRYDASMNEWVWEFRIQRHTGDWGDGPPGGATPQFPYQQTVPWTYDAARDMWIYEFRIQRGTGGWN